MTFDPERYHRRSVRLQGNRYDAGTFFVTICTYQRECIFGRVDDGRMVPNEFGSIVLDEWHRSASLRQELDHVAVALMPNHLHGLVVLNPDTDVAGVPEPDGLQTAATAFPVRRLPRSLGAFVGGFKAACTSKIREVSGDPELPVWQRGYHEHLVRTDFAMASIANYILTNSLRWALDPDNPDSSVTDEFDVWLIGDGGGA